MAELKTIRFEDLAKLHPPANDSQICPNKDKILARENFEFQEMDGYRESFSYQEQSAERVFGVLWSQRHQFVEHFLGRNVNEDSLIKRDLPEQHPERPWLYADSVAMMDSPGKLSERFIFARCPDGTILKDDEDKFLGSRMIKYEDAAAQYGGGEGLAIYRVTYKTHPFELLTDDQAILRAAELNIPRELTRFVERDVSFSVQNIPLGKLASSGSLISFTEGPAGIKGTKVPEAGVKIFPREQLLYRWHRVPDVPYEHIANIVGKVNSKTFDNYGGRSFRKETLLCQAPKVVRLPRDPARGKVNHMITYVFDYNPEGWNKLPASDGNFYRVGFGGDPNKPIYPLVEFNNLFTQPNPPAVYQ